MASFRTQLKAEVATVLGRELIGHESAMVYVAADKGMVNPHDIAKHILATHIDNMNRSIAIQQNQVVELEKQLRIVNDWTVA